MENKTSECPACGSIQINYEPIPIGTIKHLKQESYPKYKSKNVQAGVVPIDANSQELAFVFCSQCGFKYGKVTLENCLHQVVSEVLRRDGVPAESKYHEIRNLISLFYREIHSPESSERLVKNIVSESISLNRIDGESRLK